MEYPLISCYLGARQEWALSDVFDPVVGNAQVTKSVRFKGLQVLSRKLLGVLNKGACDTIQGLFHTAQLPVVSLFTGAGGLDLAAKQVFRSGDKDVPLLRTAVALDLDPTAISTFKENFPMVPTLNEDIRQVSTIDILKAAGLGVGEATLVIGGPPCTPFSKSGYWLPEKLRGEDPNASLLDDFVRVIRESKPEAFVFENVQGITYKRQRPVFDRFLGQLEDLGYCPQWKVLLAADYGVPQLRRRTFVIGRRDGKRFIFPEPTHGGISERIDSSHPDKKPYVTSRDAIGDLLPGTPEDGEIVDGRYGELAAEVPPGYNYLWHTERMPGRNKFKWRSRYWTFLLRLDPNRPSTTLQAQPGPWVGPFHWENVENKDGVERARRLRVPEILRLMTFPDDFKLVGNRTDVQRHLGNAVPVRLGAVVIHSLMEQLGYISGGSEVKRSLYGHQIELRFGA